MSDGIFGQRAIYHQRPAWHRKGITFPLEERITVEEAVERIASDIRVEKRQLYYCEDGKYFEAGDNYAILRHPTGDETEMYLIGTATGRFAIDQFEDYATALNVLSERFPVETAGVLYNGKSMFIALRGEDTAVRDIDEIQNYFVIHLSHEPGIAHRVIHTPVRVVCQNTLTLGIERATTRVSIPHSQDQVGVISITADVLAQLEGSEQRVARIFDAMSRMKISDEGLNTILNATIPTPPRPARIKVLDELTDAQLGEMGRSVSMESTLALAEAYDRQVYLSAIKRHAIRRHLETFNAMHPEFENTVWAAYNAATEYVDWGTKRKATAESVLVGARSNAKRHAFGAAMALCGMGVN